MKKFFTYIYLNPLKKGPFKYYDLEYEYEPFYVGYGQNKRHLDHLNEARKYPTIKGNKHKINTIQKIWKNGKSPIIFKIVTNVFKDDAKNLEIDLILKIGRSDLKTGPLTNMTSGGDTAPDNRGAKNAMFGLKGKNHPASDWVRSPEYLKRQSDSHKGSKNWMTGKTVPKEQRDRQSKKLKNTIRSWTVEEFNKKYKNRICSNETKQKIRNSLTGDRNPRFGHKLSEVEKKKISESLLKNGCNKGSKNGKSKKWKVLDPNNTEFIVMAGLGNFCRDNNLGSFNGLVNAGLENRKVTRGKSKGWTAIELKKGNINDRL